MLFTALNIRKMSTAVTSRVFAISDLHVDIKENLKFVENWSEHEYKNDVLLVAGDVTDKLNLLESTLQSFKGKFKEVFFVPGNHELWIRKEQIKDSIDKFHHIIEMLARIGVHTKPTKLTMSAEKQVWIVPLFSWYSKPEDDITDSLYLTPSGPRREDVNFSESVWMDNFLCKWPDLEYVKTPAEYFLCMNESFLATFSPSEIPVISFSHFVPRLDLILQTEEDLSEVNKFRFRHFLGEAPKYQGGVKGFNFTRYAGSKRLESQLRNLGSNIHVYGHQHRNRDRVIDGVRYVSHCLGNVAEQKEGWTWGLDEWCGPKQIWP